MPMLDDWVKVTEAATALRVSKARVHQMIEQYDIETLKYHPRLTLLKKTDVDRLAKMDRPSGVHIDQRQRKRRKKGA